MRLVVFLLLVAIVHGLSTDCTSDADCPAGTGCITVKYSSYNPRTVGAKCTPKMLCRGSSIGNCPSFNAPSAPGGLLQTQCVFVNTTRLRGINCCTGNANNLSSGQLSNGTATAVIVKNEPIDSDDCFQCYRDPTASKGGYYAGQFFCVPQTQCKSISVFPKACAANNLCTSGPNQLCNYHGTCTPLDIDDPKSSYGCKCKPGFTGGQCEIANSSLCSFDCGDGNTKGSCVDNECVCKKGWTGPQCGLCTNDDVCNGGTCSIASGQCSCKSNSTNQYQLIANVCYAAGTSLSAKATCAGVTCGALGSCEDGACHCIQGCAGTICPLCTDPSCKSCNPANTLHPSMILVFTSLVYTIFT
ncbi:hypothetical protein THRCLA_04445 [Thraustotheca clavata]|uniref:Secreted protein n=1 Tax=Thraustotheca clavata TaxID=74557 RepID=A0A0A7CM34_9STRA|nr:secreted protein [Thraustotheca clavata]OQS03260.1 hypothetical protein THRCLA_04445 [Thraustotheca clavata]